MASFHERYLDGDRTRVWHELRQLGSAVRGPDHLADAEAVVREAMQRARRNVEALVVRLRGERYVFDAAPGARTAQTPVAPPDARTPQFVAWLERRCGTLPLTARAWIEIVGDVDLSGVHPFWPERRFSNPFVMEFECKSSSASRDKLREGIAAEYEMQLAEPLEDPGPFRFSAAPPGVNDGVGYSILLPDESADAMFQYEDGVLVPFIEYLRFAFRWGGCPGNQKYIDPGAYHFWRGLGRELEPL